MVNIGKRILVTNQLNPEDNGVKESSLYSFNEMTKELIKNQAELQTTRILEYNPLLGDLEKFLYVKPTLKIRIFNFFSEWSYRIRTAWRALKGEVE